MALLKYGHGDEITGNFIGSYGHLRSNGSGHAQYEAACPMKYTDYRIQSSLYDLILKKLLHLYIRKETLKRKKKW